MKKTIITAILTLLTLSAFAERDPVKGGIPRKVVEAFRPVVTETYMGQYDLAIFAEDFYGQKNARGYWDVFSDREENITYDSPSCKKQYGKLSFKEKVRIVKIKQDCALVYSLPEYESEFPKMLPVDFCRGWIPISNLIICTKPLVNKEGTPIKFMLADRRGSGDEGEIKVYCCDGPVSGKKQRSLPDCTNAFFYYVKSSGRYTLLALSEDLGVAENIYGWVETDALLRWDGRIAAEPNYEPTEISTLEKNSASVEICVSNTEPPIGRIPFGMASKNPYDVNSYKMPDKDLRFPCIFSNWMNNGRFAIPYNCRYLFEPAEPLTVGFPGEDEIYRNINILFVLDGSRSYEQFFPIIAESLDSMNDKFGEQFIVRAGAIIYHDSRTTDKMIESYPITNASDSNLSGFIDDGGEYGFIDNLSNAPLCSVLEMAAEYNGFEAGDSNYIIVIGGRGDDSDSEILPAGIAEKMAYRDIKLYGIQVRGDNHSCSYRNFRYFIEDILLPSGYEAAGPETGVHYSFDQLGFRISSFYDGNGAARSLPGLCSCQSGIMSEDEFSTVYDSLLDNICQDARGEGGECGANTAMFFKSVLMDVKNGGIPTLKGCALYSQKEMEDLLEFYRKLHKFYILRVPTSRQGIFQTIESRVKVTYPVEKLNIRYQEFGYIDIFRMIEGLPFDNAYSGDKFKDFAPGKGIPDEYFFHIMTIVNQKYQKLESVYCSPEHYSSVINGETYFWVPLDYLM